MWEKQQPFAFLCCCLCSRAAPHPRGAKSWSCILAEVLQLAWQQSHGDSSAPNAKMEKATSSDSLCIDSDACRMIACVYMPLDIRRHLPDVFASSVVFKIVEVAVCIDTAKQTLFVLLMFCFQL